MLVNKVEIYPEILDGKIGSVSNFNISIFPSEATNKKLIITSSNPNIIEVFGNSFRFKQVGSAEITIQSDDGNYKKQFQLNCKNEFDFINTALKLEERLLNYYNNIKQNLEYDKNIFLEIIETSKKEIILNSQKELLKLIKEINNQAELKIINLNETSNKKLNEINTETIKKIEEIKNSSSNELEQISLNLNKVKEFSTIFFNSVYKILDEEKLKFDNEIFNLINKEKNNIENYINNEIILLRDKVNEILLKIDKREEICLTTLNLQTQTGIQFIEGAEKTAIENIRLETEEMKKVLQNELIELNQLINLELEKAINTIKKNTEGSLQEILKLEITVKNRVDLELNNAKKAIETQVEIVKNTLNEFSLVLKAELTAKKDSLMEEIIVDKDSMLMEMEKEKNRLIQLIKDQEIGLIQGLYDIQQTVVTRLQYVIQGYDTVMEEAKNFKIAELNTAIIGYEDMITNAKNLAMESVTRLSDGYLKELLQNKTLFINELNELYTLSMKNIQDLKTTSIEELTTLKTNFINSISDLGNSYLSELSKKFNQFTTELTNTKNTLGEQLLTQYNNLSKKLNDEFNIHSEALTNKVTELVAIQAEIIVAPLISKYVEDTSKPEISSFVELQKKNLEDLINRHVVQGNLVFQTLAERDSYINENNTFPEKVFIGLTVFVIDEMMNYFYKGNNSWGEFHSPATVHIGPIPPEDKTLLWINPEDEDVDATIDGEILKEFRTLIKDLQDKIYAINFSINKKIDPGIFDPPIPNENGDTIPFPKTVEKIKIKRGAKKFLEQAKLEDGELAFLKDTGELVYNNDGKYIIVNKIKGIENLSTEFLDLISPNKTKYRVRINDTGNFVIYRAELDEAPDPSPSDSGSFKGLIINQIYGGGSNVDALISHDFIELYNNTDKAINLKGLSVQCASNNSPWELLELRGEISPFSSFLIRCGSNKISEKLLYKINDYDLDWNIKISDKGTKVYLTIGRNICTVKNPFNFDGAGNKSPGYIDLIGVAGIDKTRVIDAYEKTMKHLMNKNIGIRRHDFSDKDDHHIDLRGIDYSIPENKIYLPKCSQDGSWDVAFDKEKLDVEKPSLVSITYGNNGETTRCFTWQSPSTTSGSLFYCKKVIAKKRTGAIFTEVQSKIRQIQHKDCDATVHSAIVTDLTPGIYIYRVAFKSETGENKFTPVKEFEVKTYTNDSTIKILHTTDQQSWDSHEYDCWKFVNQFLDKTYPINTYDFRLNTGDISQNANRSFEWRYYFKHALETLSTTVEMSTIGNNDLIDKLYNEAWTYYYTYENSPIPSVYSFDLGYCHFVSLDSWVGLPHHFELVPAPTPEDPNATIKVDKHLQAQLDWLDKDLAKTTKRWKIVYMHLSPYTVSVNVKQKPFAEIFEKHGVHLVICGHNHCYSRSLPLKGFNPNESFNGKQGIPIVNQTEGIYYVLGQASGFKLSGKDKPKPNTPWIPQNEDTNNGTNPKNPCWTPDQPSYIIWEINYNQIIMKSYMLKGLINKDPQFSGTNKEYNSIENIENFLFDTLVINHR